jgi:hypothetical protein
LIPIVSSGFLLATNKKYHSYNKFLWKKKMPRLPDFEDLKKEITIF